MAVHSTRVTCLLYVLMLFLPLIISIDGHYDDQDLPAYFYKPAGQCQSTHNTSIHYSNYGSTLPQV